MKPNSKRFKIDPEYIERGYQIERNVGITQFVSKHKPFIGVLKHRFEDFVVHEIDKKGNVLKLENIDKPEDIIIDEKISADLVHIDQSLIDANLKKLIDDYVKSNFESENLLLPIDGLNKQERSQLHLYIKQNYSDFESRTETIDNKKVIKIIPMKQLKNKEKRKQYWPRDKPNYIRFILYKENLETLNVVTELSRRLRLTTKFFSFAGSKDKRCISTQMFSAYRINPLKIWKAVDEFNQCNINQTRIQVGHFHFNPEPLHLGDLNGNKFEIILRNIHLIDDFDNNSNNTSLNNKINDVIEQAFNSVQNQGFINYYGMQRFGSYRIDSHKLGILILRKEFKKFFEEILCEKKPDDLWPFNHGNRRDISVNEAIRIWKETGDACLAYKKLYYKYTIEGLLLRALTKTEPNDFNGALCIGMPRNSRLLYLHAYQSYLWNRIASFRIEKYGFHVAEGDLVFVGPDFDQYDDENQIETEIETSVDKKIKANIPNEQIILVTRENIERFTIFDVVLPVIGTLTKYPTNYTKDFIDELLKEDNVSITQFASLGKEWCVNGSYRKLLIKPTELSWNLIEYYDNDKPLILSDLDRIKGNAIEEQNKKETVKLALKIDVALPSSCYATIFLREITKVSSLTLEKKYCINQRTKNDDNIDADQRPEQ